MSAISSCVALFALVEVREFLLQMGNLGSIVINDVRIVGMKSRVILMIGLGSVEGLQPNNLRDDRAREDSRFVELRDVGFGDSLLVFGGIENRRPVLRARIGSLPVQFCRIVRHGEKDFQKLSVSDLRWVVSNLHRLGVAGIT